MKSTRRRKDAGDPASPPPEVEPLPRPAEEAAGLRCPFCKGELPGGALAAACALCGTLHHPGCFAEHHGCSTHGCESARGVSVVVGAPPPPPFQPLTCWRCRQPCPPDAIVARCCACLRVQHTACYEQGRACVSARCQGRVELLPHREAVQERLREGSGLLVKLGGLGLLLGCLGGWALLRWGIEARWVRDALVSVGVGAGLLTVLSLLACSAGLKLRARARAVATLPPRPRAEDAVKRLEKELGADLR